MPSIIAMHPPRAYFPIYFPSNLPSVSSGRIYLNSWLKYYSKGTFSVSALKHWTAIQAKVDQECKLVCGVCMYVCVYPFYYEKNLGVGSRTHSNLIWCSSWYFPHLVWHKIMFLIGCYNVTILLSGFLLHCALSLSLYVIIFQKGIKK